MALPTVTTIRARSKVDFEDLGYSDDDDLQVLVDLAISQMTRYTGQSWSIGGIYSGIVPAEGTEPMASYAVQKLTELFAFRNSEDVMETMADFDLLTSFSVGEYSESRRQGKDAKEASLALLGELLWPLMTFDKQDEWIFLTGGLNAPAFAVTEVDWSRQLGRPVLGDRPDPTAGPFWE